MKPTTPSEVTKSYELLTQLRELEQYRWEIAATKLTHDVPRALEFLSGLSGLILDKIAVAVDLILREEALIVREAIAARGVDTADLSVAPPHTPN